MQDISKGSERITVTWSRSNFAESTATSGSGSSAGGATGGGAAKGRGGGSLGSWSRELPSGFVYSTNYVYDAEVPVLGPVTTDMSQVCQAKHEVTGLS